MGTSVPSTSFSSCGRPEDDLCVLENESSLLPWRAEAESFSWTFHRNRRQRCGCLPQADFHFHIKYSPKVCWVQPPAPHSLPPHQRGPKWGMPPSPSKSLCLPSPETSPKPYCVLFTATSSGHGYRSWGQGWGQLRDRQGLCFTNWMSLDNLVTFSLGWIPTSLRFFGLLYTQTHSYLPFYFFSGKTEY